MQADRLLVFLSIWGNGEPDQYTQDNVVYVSSLRRLLLQNLDFQS